MGALAQFQIIGAVLGRLGELGPELEVADRDLRAAGRGGPNDKIKRLIAKS